MSRNVRLALVVLVSLLMVPAVTYAQASITGVVRDTSGAVLPGVTVEAASPALIERVRLAVTDGGGRYRIEDLRPGSYSVTFTLSGFSILRREGIQLTGTFIATVNADLQVGALEETVTVTGEGPVVDVQSSVRQRVMDQEVLDVLPANRAPAFAAGIVPGVTRNHDVGGITGDGSGTGSVSARGVHHARIMTAGMPNLTGLGAPHRAYNLAAYQELVVETGGMAAEYSGAGVRMQLIPKDGGNTFTGSFLGAFANGSMAWDNLTQDLRDRGLRAPGTIKQLADVNPALGGPIRKDSVWFFGTARYQRAWNYVPVLFNKHAGNPDVWIYEPDTSRKPASNENTIRDLYGRATWQVTPRNRLAGSYQTSYVCDCPRGLSATLAPEAAAGRGNWVRDPWLSQLHAEWKTPITNRVLLEANVFRQSSKNLHPQSNHLLPPGSQMIGVTEQSTGLQYRAGGAGTSENLGTKTLFARSLMSFVTGAHSFKVGFIGGWATRTSMERAVDAPMNFRLQNGVPNRLTLFARPHQGFVNMDADHGLFVEDRWTIDRLTLTGGLRYAYFKLSFPENRVGPTEFTPDRNFLIPKSDGPAWHEALPRGSLALDVFGDGRTALKMSLGRYLVDEFLAGTLFASQDPANRLVTSTFRSWNDANSDFVPDCDLLNRAANGECGPWSDANFGSLGSALAFDPEVMNGWGNRRYYWQFAAGVEREIVPGVSLQGEYWRTSYRNFIVTQNRAYGPDDFDEFSITAPVDPRLPGGGGYLVSGLADVKPELFGREYDGFVTFAENFGKQTEHWNGVDITVDVRPRPGVLLQGGTSTERQSTDNCEVVRHAGGEPPSRGSGLPAYNPSQLHCRVQGTFLTQLKLLGSFTVPRIDVQVTASLQNLPGPGIAADYVATNAAASPSLGRNLAGRASSVTVNLVEPRTMYGERLNHLDLRIGKILRFGGTRATASVDLYNVLNSSAVLSMSNAYASWQRPQSIINSRFAKVVVQLDF